MTRVLVVDDEKNIRTTLLVCLEGLGAEVRAVATGTAALAEVAHAAAPFDLAFVDLRLADESGLDVIPALLGAAPSLAIILITAYADIETAVQAVKRGAWELLPKPFTPSQIRHLVERARERQGLVWRVASLEDRLRHTDSEVDLDTAVPTMRAVLESAARVAASDATVLVRGENGTGKSVLARAIHARSARAERPFVTVNCPTLSDELLASELFGHARGAFTGAVRDQEGRVEAAQGGTLFLDEIGELPPPLQAKLLRFLQDKEFERVGETKTRRADVRIIAATNQDLDSAVAAGRFRQDLLYRLNVVELALPALRDRAADIVPMARGLLASLARAAGRPDVELAPDAERALAAHDWPGNVRELRNTLERALILWPARTISAAAFPDKIARSPAVAAAPSLGGDFTIDTIEREHVLRVLARIAKLEDAAHVLGIDASTLYRKRKKYEE